MATSRLRAESSLSAHEKVVPITIRVTPEEKSALQHLAEQTGLSYRRLIMGLVRNADVQSFKTTAPKPSELRLLASAERDAVLREQAKRASNVYAAYPEIIADGNDEIISY